MNAFDVARGLRAIHARFGLPGYSAPSGRVQRREIAGAYITIESGNSSPYPSSNNNRILFFGVDGEVEAADLDRILQVFVEFGIDRLCSWLSPCPCQDEIADWLISRGFSLFEGTGYPTLLRSVESPAPAPTDFSVRRVVPEEATRFVTEFAQIYKGRAEDVAFLMTQGIDGIEHFAAFDGEVPVAAAMLCHDGGLGYLCYGATLESHRNRGAQSALIRSRIVRAKELGCTHVASETLYMLDTSLGNLKRQGFEVCYDKKVFVRSGAT